MTNFLMLTIIFQLVSVGVSLRKIRGLLGEKLTFWSI